MSLLDHGLPQLARGSHKRGSGKACVMNYVSYLNGDVTITDMPSCTDPMLARVAQRLNDNICTHRQDGVLCSDCAGVMLRFASRLIGTAQTHLSDHDLRVLHVRLACGAARRVLHLVRERDRDVCEATIVAVEGWCDGTVAKEELWGARKKADDVDDAAAAYVAAAAAADAADAAAAAAYAYAYAVAAADAVAAVAAADAADAPAARVEAFTQLLDHFDQLTGHTPSEPSITDHVRVLAEISGQ